MMASLTNNVGKNCMHKNIQKRPKSNYQLEFYTTPNTVSRAGLTLLCNNYIVKRRSFKEPV